MLLLVDIGNTSTTIGFYENGFQNILNIKTLRGRSIDEYSYIINGFIKQHHMEIPDGAAICSVVPEETDLLLGVAKKNFGINAVNVDYRVNTGLTFSIRNIESLGADRIANSVAAHNIYRINSVVVDFGTATTFCIISENGEYTGGAIMAGIGLSTQVLSEKTSRLPTVKLELPEKISGEDTFGNISNGTILGHAGAVERIIHEIEKEYDEGYTVIATGGYAELVTPHIKADHVNPLLTLEGLRFIYELNSDNNG